MNDKSGQRQSKAHLQDVDRAQKAIEFEDDADFQNEDLRTVWCYGCTAKRGRFNGADLTGAIFDASDLTGASFSGAKLSSCDFQDADLTGADFRGAIDLEQAAFRGATLINVQWPQDFEPSDYGVFE